ncbi:hypothetical protein FRC14_000154 [Serendipita sp. 396]|nr:hypothetical protein FRC14_000154 [Serendipita sp. 396]
MEYLQPDPLSEKRADLLAAIETERESVQQGGSDEELSRLKDGFNQFMDDFVLAPYGRRSDPFKRLPPELFIAIITQVTSPQYPYIDRLLELTLVSRSWQTIIVSTPSLWTDLHLDSRDTPDMDIKLHLALHLSKHSALTMHVSSLDVWKAVESLIQAHRARVTNMHINPDHRYSVIAPHRSISRMYPLFDQIGYLPGLQFIRLGISYDFGVNDAFVDALIRFVNQNPHIERLSGAPLVHKFLDHPARKILTNIDTPLDLSSVLPYIDSMPAVQSASFQDKKLLPIKAYHMKERLTPVPTGPLKWTSFISSGKLFHPLLPPISKTLVTLKLDICICDACPLLKSLSNLVVLNEVILTVQLQEDYPTDPAAAMLLQCPAQILRIQLQEQVTLAGRLSIGDIQRWYPRFVTDIFSVFSMVQKLSVYTSFRSSMGLEIIPSNELRYLKSLSFNLEPYHTTQSLQFPSTLRTLAIGINSHNLEGIHSETVEVLSLQSRSRTTPKLNLSHWPALCFLDARPGIFSVDWSNDRLHNLQKIRFYGTTISTWDYTTQFCCDLALHPEAIPCLDSLIFQHEFPELDIVFILLERYNFRKQLGSSRIRQLRLMGPSDLIAPLKKICDGKFTDRPPNHEISWVGNIDMILDASPGCLRCHKTLSICQWQGAPFISLQ